MKIFIDTNIFIDFVCKRHPFYDNVKRLFALGYIGQVSLVVSSLSFVNTVYVGKKYGMSSMKSRLKSIVPFIEVSGLSAESVIESLNNEWNDYEDSVQSYSAESSEADCIVTRNKKDFIKASLPVYSPDELLKLFE